jgi:hypothetical protein
MSIDENTVSGLRLIGMWVVYGLAIKGLRADSFNAVEGIMGGFLLALASWAWLGRRIERAEDDTRAPNLPQKFEE